jgi:hypothetical protein
MCFFFRCGGSPPPAGMGGRELDFGREFLLWTFWLPDLLGILLLSPGSKMPMIVNWSTEERN